MKQGQARKNPIRRGDYHPPAFLTDELTLDVSIEPQRTLVNSRFEVYRNPDAAAADEDLCLDGADLELLSLHLDGRALADNEYRIDGERLLIPGIAERAEVTIQVAIDPVANTALEGLYASGDFLLTQCEPQGFRKITWFMDRPDVMCAYRVSIEADRERFPVLLCNGNQTGSETLDGNRHRVSWYDPYAKPSYLFALVAGDLALVDDTFTTTGGREVLLRFVVEHGSEEQCRFAIQSLKNAMRWDEQRFGLEYDLDIYHVVVTHDFNMGAMENKSLNIFNSHYVLAERETATDQNFQAVESVIAHEYFHNWTGNRVTCRDWFQLTLKEGLTVFRDREFSSDMQSAAVERINNVRGLRERQFAEDAGPMAHPIRPDEYLEINNFYTATVYEKGSEIIRMYQTLLGREGFRRGMDLYFERHDGQAVTCDDFLAAMADANDADLSQFSRWYSQTGTPEVCAELEYQPERQRCILHLSQKQRDTGSEPLLIPVAVGLLNADGDDIPLYGEAVANPGETTTVLRLSQTEQQFVFTDVPETPLPSLLRGFSAPVKLKQAATRAELARRMAHDSDSFNRWDAAERLQLDILKTRVAALDAGESPSEDDVFAPAMLRILEDEELDPALAALALTPVSENYLAQQIEIIDVESVYQAISGFMRSLMQHPAVYEALQKRLRQAAEETREWSLDTRDIGLRRLHSVLLGYWMKTGEDAALDYCRQRYFNADNMTDRLATMHRLANTDSGLGEECLADFGTRYQDNPLVLDKWFTIQAVRHHLPVMELERLMEHPAFSIKNPNKVRAVISAFAHGNPTGFHAVDGSGYAFVAERIIELNSLNPQVAARLAGCFNRWRHYTEDRRDAMHAQLERIAGAGQLSPDVFEVVSNALEKG